VEVFGRVSSFLITTTEIPPPALLCNCTNNSAEISELSVDVEDNTVSITVTKLDDCEMDYVILVNDSVGGTSQIIGEEDFVLYYYGDEAFFVFNLTSEESDSVTARLYCLDTYLEGRLEDYLDMEGEEVERPEVAAPEPPARPEGPTGWELGLLWLLLAILAILAVLIWYWLLPLLAKRKKKKK
jgi:hypothetical protein